MGFGGALLLLNGGVCRHRDGWGGKAGAHGAGGVGGVGMERDNGVGRYRARGACLLLRGAGRRAGRVGARERVG